MCYLSSEKYEIVPLAKGKNEGSSYPEELKDRISYSYSEELTNRIFCYVPTLKSEGIEFLVIPFVN